MKIFKLKFRIQILYKLISIFGKLIIFTNFILLDSPLVLANQFPWDSWEPGEIAKILLPISRSQTIELYIKKEYYGNTSFYLTKNITQSKIGEHCFHYTLNKLKEGQIDGIYPKNNCGVNGLTGKFLLQIANKLDHFFHVRRSDLLDYSTVTSSDGTEVSLRWSGLLINGKTWYERNGFSFMGDQAHYSSCIKSIRECPVEHLVDLLGSEDEKTRFKVYLEALSPIPKKTLSDFFSYAFDHDRKLFNEAFKILRRPQNENNICPDLLECITFIEKHKYYEKKYSPDEAAVKPILELQESKPGVEDNYKKSEVPVFLIKEGAIELLNLLHETESHFNKDDEVQVAIPPSQSDELSENAQTLGNKRRFTDDQVNLDGSSERVFKYPKVGYQNRNGPEPTKKLAKRNLEFCKKKNGRRARILRHGRCLKPTDGHSSD